MNDYKLFHNAKKAKNDEYHTDYNDIENDLSFYEADFSGKTVYCPCDDFRWSNFVRYFKTNYHRLHLTGLLASNYDIGEGAYKYRYDGNVEVYVPTPTGDFRTDEIDPLLRASDVIVTNPPFSLLRDFYTKIRGKEMLIMAPLTAAAYNAIFPDIKEGRLNVDVKGYRQFTSSEGEKKNITNLIWLTTFNPPYQPLELTETYSEEKYPFYDNHPDIIEVGRTKRIPRDYQGKMGVPLSYIKYHHREDFTLLDTCEDPVIGGVTKFRRFIVSAQRGS